MRPAIVAVNQTPYSPRHDQHSLEELIYLTVRDLLSSTDASIEDVDHIAIASSDDIDGRAISCMVTGGSVGDHMRDLINSSSCGEHALILACLRIMSERSRLVLVVNWAKPSEAPIPRTDVTQLEPFFHRSLGLERTAFLALQAQAYLHRHSLGTELAAIVVEKNSRNACLNPLAARRRLVSRAQAASSEIVAWPLRRADLPPLDDGVVAMLVANPDTARALTTRPAEISGFGWNTDSFWRSDEDLASLGPVSRAAKSAYRMAGIANPTKDLDLLEIMDLTPYHEIMAYEALGICGPGEGGSLLSTGVTQRDGSLPVNPSGGLQGANPDFVAGLARVAEVALQVTGQAGERQIRGARVAVAEMVGGLAAQSASVFILAGS